MDQKVYYIIGNYYKEDGLFSMYKHTIAHVLHAVEHDYVPVVDMRCYYNQYFKDGRVYRDNPWEYFFEQPYGVSPQNIPQNAKIIIASGSADAKFQIYSRHLPLSLDNNILPHPYLMQYNDFLRFAPDIKEYLLSEYQKIFNNEKNVLGIIVRGTDFVETKPKGHAIQPTAEMIIAKVKEMQQNFEINKIYLATEDKKIYDKIKAEFNDLLIDNNSYKYDTVNGKLIYRVKAKRKDHFYNLAKEYMLSLYLLSRCKYFIGGRANGTLAVYMMTKGFSCYEYVYLWDLGCYGDKDTTVLNKVVPNKPKNNIVNHTFKILGIPLLRINLKNRSKRAYLFNFIPLYKTTHYPQETVFKLFNIITLLKKRTIKKI